MAIKRLRVFAGPNGSGKTTIPKIVREHYDLGIYVNADDIKLILQQEHRLVFSQYELNISRESFIAAFEISTILEKTDRKGILKTFDVQGNELILDANSPIDDYFVSFVADFLRDSLLAAGKKFSFETVMSHHSKVDFMKKAHENGYKVYLYYVALRNPELNIMRVNGRVASGGHDVPPDKIRERYYDSLGQLSSAIEVADKSYIFDNSGGEHRMIAQVIDKELEILVDYYPEWFDEYYLRECIPQK